MNISKDTFDIFFLKYVQVIYNIFLVNKTSDINFGIFSWKYDENLNISDEIKYKSYLLDHKINSLKTSCLMFINYLFNKSKKQIKDTIIIDIIYNLIKIGQEFLGYIVLNKSNYFQYFNNNKNDNYNNCSPLKSDYYECLIFQYMNLFANVFSTHPFKDNLGFDIIK
jgi:hypothetical protein